MTLVARVLEAMSSNRIGNYIAPGLESVLLGREDSKVRMFTMTRDQEMYISPHNHRFDFFSIVVEGLVRQHLYAEVSNPYSEYAYNVYDYVPTGQFSETFEKQLKYTGFFKRETQNYEQGSFYSMGRDQFHSIEFSRGTKVLFFEGPMVKSISQFLEPVVNDKETSLFSIPPWMYHD